MAPPAQKTAAYRHSPDVLEESPSQPHAHPVVHAEGATPEAPELDFTRMFREMAPVLWRALRRLGVPESDAEDVLQEVFLVVHRKLPEFQGRSTLRTWATGFCLRKALTYRRSARVRREVLGAPLLEPTAAPTQNGLSPCAARARSSMRSWMGSPKNSVWYSCSSSSKVCP